MYGGKHKANGKDKNLARRDDLGYTEVQQQ